jgi:transposase
MKKDTREGSGLTVGVDLGDRWSRYCVLDPQGQILEEETIATTGPAFRKLFGDRPAARVVIEVGTHSPWVSRWLEAKGYEVIVANARAVRSIAESDRKTDRNDAEQLARLGRVDPKLLHPIRHRGEAAQRHRMLLAIRDHLVRTRSSFIVQARGLAKGLGERLPRCTSEAFAKRMREERWAQLFPAMDVIVTTVDQLNAHIARLDEQLEALARSTYPETLLLRQISGVGLLTALAFVLTLEDPARFKHSRAVGSFLGLTVRRRQSGARDPALRITKAGDFYLRRLLIQCALRVLTLGPDCDLRRFGEQLSARRGNKKAVVAVARKLAMRMHRLWTTGELYEPLYDAERKALLAAA